MTSRETFARNLRALRLERGFTQEELAHRAGVDRTYVSALERKVYAPSVDVLDQLATAVGVDPWTLIMPVEME